MFHRRGNIFTFLSWLSETDLTGFLLPVTGRILEIIWHGHSCFEVRGSRTIVFDPHDGKSIGIPAPVVSADTVFVSHDHFDHNAVRSVHGDPQVVNEPVEGDLAGMNTRTHVLPHDTSGGQKRGMVRCYRVEMDWASMLHLGDVGDLPPGELIEKEQGVSFLFLPVGGVFTIGPREAVKWIEALKPQVAVPMHYRVGGISLSIRPVEDFLAMVSRKVMKVGHTVSFQAGDLTGDPAVWVFSP